MPTVHEGRDISGADGGSIEGGGDYDISLSTGDLAKGIYVFLIVDINGERHFSRLVRN